MSKIVWLTGLSGSGKTTLSKILLKKLLNKKYKVKHIDGDIFRKKKKTNSFTKKNIIKNNMSIINYVKKIQTKYDYIIISVISPLIKTRTYAKQTFKEKYFEIFVSCKIKNLEIRDTKGLYKKAKKNIIQNLIGYNSKIRYEKSPYKRIVVITDKYSVKECISKILSKIL